MSRVPIGQLSLLYIYFSVPLKLVRKMAEHESGDWERRAIGPLRLVRGGHLKAEGISWSIITLVPVKVLMCILSLLSSETWTHAGSRIMIVSTPHVSFCVTAVAETTQIYRTTDELSISSCCSFQFSSYECPKNPQSGSGKDLPA